MDNLNDFFLKKKGLSFFLSILFWFLLSHLIFNIQILGESLNHQKLIQESLQSYKAIPPFFLWDKNKLRQQLSDDLVEEIHWLTIHQEGGKLEIHYLPKNSQNEDTKDDLDLIAEKDGMIVAFDVKSGTKKVVINQFVAKDEVLVSHILLDSHNQEQTSLVEGKVYAYTFQEIGIEINKNSLPQFVQYYDCLLQIRQQLHEIISEGEHIVQEIPLIFEEKEDKIRMVNYYVLYEQIAVKRSFNE